MQRVGRSADDPRGWHATRNDLQVMVPLRTMPKARRGPTDLRRNPFAGRSSETCTTVSSGKSPSLDVQQVAESDRDRGRTGQAGLGGPSAGGAEAASVSSFLPKSARGTPAHPGALAVTGASAEIGGPVQEVHGPLVSSPINAYWSEERARVTEELSSLPPGAAIYVNESQGYYGDQNLERRTYYKKSDEGAFVPFRCGERRWGYQDAIACAPMFCQSKRPAEWSWSDPESTAPVSPEQLHDVHAMYSRVASATKLPD